MFKKSFVVALFILIPFWTYAYTSPLDILKSLQAQLDSITRLVDGLKQAGQVSGANSKTPVAAYAFDEGTGNTVGDKSGNGNSGTLVGSPTWGTGKSGNGLIFNGTSGHVSFGDLSALDNLAKVTVSAWVKTTVTGEKHIIDKSNCNGVTNSCPFEIGTGLFSGGKAAFVFYKNGGNPDYTYTEIA